ncbi:putative stress-inducible protein STI1-like [Trypanosoma rangeli]|uniref:Putative stress-inducible protein STI1-like n=1 Tax=Trypanosoma rangeli TaxID=5698 RepID=A0A3R7KJ25_TRYRA|nr:putative stress-inducible protein STI1-like [Trypanosoma rangeli]RNF07447.1 putative stress-inducible protein STI1-like [Trypanosoma rangeli]|eukprot:RNF07447.1 putative stress-inducible protein STI1-like [Trypanosoma rangeli]
MNGGGIRNYSAKVLLAQDDRLRRFLDASISQDWETAVREWHTLKQEDLAFQKQAHSIPCVDVRSACKTNFFSDEEFFFLTKQLESITIALSGPSAPSAGGAHHADNDVAYASSQVQDLFLLDPAMLSNSLDEEKQRKCQEASEVYQSGSYSEAAKIFSSVIDSCLPNMLNAPLIGNRAACYLRMENYKLSLRDAVRSYEMDNEYILGVRRAVRSLICCGKVVEAQQTMEVFKKNKCGYTFAIELTDLSLYKKYITFLERNEHAIALRYLSELLERVPCASFEVLKVQLLAIEDGNEVALAYANNILQCYTEFPDLLYWCAQLRFLESANKAELEAVLPFCTANGFTDSTGRLRQVLQRTQHCIEFCKEMDLLYAKSEWMPLIHLCSKCVKIPFVGDRLRAGILTRRARGFFEVKRYYDCMDDIEAALQNTTLGNERAQLLLLKALAEEKLFRWLAAIRNAELAMKEHCTIEIVEVWKRLCDGKEKYERRQQQRKQRSQFRPRKQDNEESDYTDGDRGSERSGFSRNQAAGSGRNERQKKHIGGKDPRLIAQLYAQLSIPTGASAEKVKKSYRALAMRWHPDRWCGAPDQQRKEAEEKFKTLKAAYDELMCIVGG